MAKGKSKVKGQKSKVASQRLSGRTQSGGGSVAAGDSAAGLWQRWAPADRHLFQIELCRPRLGLPFAFQIVAEPVELLAVFAGQDNGTSAQAVPEGVHADGSLSFGSLGAGGFERIATIGVDLMDCCHMVFYEQSQFGAAPGN